MNKIIKQRNIEELIYEIRGMKVMLASDVAKLYNSETKIINQVVKRNIKRFPEKFCFQLTIEEYINLRSQIVTSKSNDNLKENSNFLHGGNRYLPYAFTEHGIMMLAGLLKNDFAAEVNVMIINAFISMRKYISDNLLEQNYYNELTIKHESEIKLLKESFHNLQSKRVTNEIYFEGQIYDAYSKIIDIFQQAKNEITIIDGYADKTTLDIISRLEEKVNLIVKEKSLLTNLDIGKYQSQYNNLKIIYSNKFHDRYFIIDNNLIYHCGTSINHAGSKTFSINILEDDIVKEKLIEYINIVISE